MPQTQTPPRQTVSPSPPDLTDQEVARFKAMLKARIRELSEQDSDLRARLASPPSAKANTFVAGTEGAMAAEADDEVIALLQHEQAELVAAQHALERIDHGDYGYCTECGVSIGLARLEVLPDAQLCVDCQDMMEHRKGR